MSNNKKENISLKKPLIWATCSCLLTLALGIGAFVYLFIDFGGKKTVAEVPDLVGKSITEVERRNFEHFKIEKEPAYSDEYASGVIISQQPRGRSKKVIRGGEMTVKVKVSIGKEKLTIPNLYGFDCYEAACRLRELGALVRFVYVYDNSYSPDEVIKSSPLPDTPIERGEKVTLFVCREHIKQPVSVRDLTGMSREDAVRTLMSDGLVLGRVITLPSSYEYDGRVIGQSIPSGAIVKWGTVIDITVAESGETSGFYMGDGELDIYEEDGRVQNKTENNTENGE